jgi:hypothetical protein
MTDHTAPQERQWGGLTIQRYADGSFAVSGPTLWFTVDPSQDAEENFARELIELLGTVWIAASPGTAEAQPTMRQLAGGAFYPQVTNYGTPPAVDAARPAAQTAPEVEAEIAELREANRMTPDHQQLAKFYGVTTYAALVQQQAHHITKLQAKLPPSPSLAPQRVREG